MSPFTKADAIAWLLGRSCEACGTALPAPGQPCEACGWLPQVTAPELAEQLSGPRALAQVHAAKLRAEGDALIDEGIARHREADRAAIMVALEEVRAEAQAALEQALEAQGPLERAVRAAGKPRARAERDLKAARETHEAAVRAQELAQRMRHGPQAETDAGVRVAEAARVLARYEAAFREASRQHAAAQGALSAHEQKVTMLERARDTAAATCDNPGRIPFTAETIEAGIVRLVLGGHLDEVELRMASVSVRVLAVATGAAEDIETDARREMAAEREKEARGRPVHARPARDGGFTATANPFYPRAQDAFHVPAPPS